MQADLTVIIPFFNDHKTIDRAIESIKNQILLPKEIIIIDDCSVNPLNIEYIKKITNKNINLIVLRNKKNQGASFSRNIGIKHAKSKYIAFLDSDDIWHPMKISIQYNIMEFNNLSFSYHIYSSNNKYPINFKKIENPSLKKIKKIRFLFGNFICTPTVMARKEDFIFFDERLTRMEDYKCWIDNCLDKEIHCINSPLSFGFKKPIGSSGLSASIPKMHYECLKSLSLLKNEKKISRIFYLSAKIIEIIKFHLR